MRTILITIALSMVSFFSAPLCAGTLSLSDGGNITAAPGDTTGWGFSFISTDPLLWSVLTFSEFLPGTDFGTYGDYIALPQNFYEAPPFIPVTSGFDPVNQLGIGEFILAPSAPAGTVISGTIRLHYDTYLGDPDSGGLREALDNTLDVPATITVNDPLSTPATAPEPSSLWPAGACIALAFAAKARRGSRCA
jgi:hypothetical protein